jgi:hypothetical protein
MGFRLGETTAAAQDHDAGFEQSLIVGQVLETALHNGKGLRVPLVIGVGFCAVNPVRDIVRCQTAGGIKFGECAGKVASEDVGDA